MINLKGYNFIGFANNSGTIAPSVIPIGQPPSLPVKGFALKLQYNVTQNDSSHVGWGYLFFEYDSTRREYLFPQALGLKVFSFWVKGENGGERFGVNFIDTAEKSSKPLGVTDSIERKAVSTEWQKMSFLLDKFEGEENKEFNFSRLKHFNIYFFNGLTPNSGTIFIDNIAFE